MEVLPSCLLLLCDHAIFKTIESVVHQIRATENFIYRNNFKQNLKQNSKMVKGNHLILATYVDFLSFISSLMLSSRIR